MYLGVDYYPEQWDPAMLEQDLDNIRELGCNAIRIGEFGWHIMEKTEGQFDFSFFDHVIARARARGQGGIFRDLLVCRDAQVLLRYRDDFYGEYAALTRKAQQKGWVYYLGCGADESLLTRLLEELCARQGLAGESSAPGVEVVYRGSGRDRIRLVMNHNPRPAAYKDQTLAPFQCCISPAEE